MLNYAQFNYPSKNWRLQQFLFLLSAIALLAVWLESAFEKTNSIKIRSFIIFHRIKRRNAAYMIADYRSLKFTIFYPCSHTYVRAHQDQVDMTKTKHRRKLQNCSIDNTSSSGEQHKKASHDGESLDFQKTQAPKICLIKNSISIDLFHIDISASKISSTNGEKKIK